MKACFHHVDGLDGVYVGPLGKLSCMALRLRNDSLCLYSPVAGLEKTLGSQVEDIGSVSALLAPNHYHNKGLSAHVKAFPSSSLYCSNAARPRLSKITGLDFDNLAGLRKALPSSVTVLEPDGLKTGEVWLQITSATDCALIVTDAFSAPFCPPGEFGTEVTLLGNFPRYGIKDVDAYKRWVNAFLSNTAPTMILPCHGSPVSSANLSIQMGRLLKDEL